MAIGFILPVTVSLFFIFTDKEGFDEYSRQFNKKNSHFIIVSLFYRMILGQAISQLNIFDEGTIVTFFIGVIYFLILIANIPFRSFYHNYRSAIIQLSSLSILFNTMYYRSMKSNESKIVLFMSMAPGIIQLATISLSTVFSFGCLISDILKRCVKKPKSSPLKKLQPINTTIVQFTENIKNESKNSTSNVLQPFPPGFDEYIWWSVF